MIPLSLRNMVPVSVYSLRPLFQLTSCNFYCCFALALSTRQLPCFFRRQLVVMFRRQQRQRKQRKERAQRYMSRGDIQLGQQDYCCQLVFFCFFRRQLVVMFRRQQRQRKQREERAQRSISRGDIQQRQQDYCCQLVFLVFF